MNPVEGFLQNLQGVTKQRNKHWMALCPGHEDKNPSLSISQGNDGRVLLKCFAGCKPERIVSALGLAMSDLFDRRNGSETAEMNRSVKSASAIRQILADGGHQATEEYFYARDVRKVRFERVGTIQPGKGKPEKTFRWEHRKDGEWWSGQGKQPVPLYANRSFRDPDIIDQAIGVEGESKADLLDKPGIPAFSYHSLRIDQCEVLADLDVILFPDKDVAGQRQAVQAALTISRSKQARSIRIIQPPDELPSQGDVVDGIRRFGWDRQRIEGLVASAVPYVPGEDPELPNDGHGSSPSPWSEAITAPEFISQGQAKPDGWRNRSRPAVQLPRSLAREASERHTLLSG